MLNNTKYKSELDELQQIVEDRLVTTLSGAAVVAANQPDFGQAKSAERSTRRVRQYGYRSGLRTSGWRVSAW